MIQEFYVMPEYRSKEIGKSIIEEIVAFAKKKKWKRLELCTPPVPEFYRTVEFYQSNGFEITGGYKMKYAIMVILITTLGEVGCDQGAKMRAQSLLQGQFSNGIIDVADMAIMAGTCRV